jgi:hypothetical protein
LNWAYRGPKKFGNKKVELDGYSFASKLEAALYGMLKMRQAAGEIRTIEVQAQVYLTDAKILYKPDFFCERIDGSIFYAEAKGYQDQKWPIKKRLWASYGPAPLEIWKGTHVRPVLVETIVPKEAKC